MGLNSTAVAIQPNVSCTCNCKRSLFQSMEISKYLSCRGPARRRGCGAGGAAALRRGRGSSRGRCGQRRDPSPRCAFAERLGLGFSPRRASSARSSVAVAVSGAGVTRSDGARAGPAAPALSAPPRALPASLPEIPARPRRLPHLAPPASATLRPPLPRAPPPRVVMRGGPDPRLLRGLHQPRVNPPPRLTGGWGGSTAVLTPE